MNNTSSNSLSFTEEQAMLLEASREFCRKKSTIEDVRKQLDTVLGYDINVWNEMVDLGWLSIAIPEHLSGSGLGVNGLVPLIENMGRAMLGTPLVSTVLAAQLLIRADAGEYSERLLQKIIEGTPATVAFLENSDWGDTKIRCKIGSDLTIQGTKDFVDDAMAAQIFILPLIKNGELVLALVDRQQISDNTIFPHVLIDQTKRSARIDFSGIKIESSQIIENGRVEKSLGDVRIIGALLVAAEQAGSSAACLDLVVDYLNTRKQFGNLIGSYQALKHPTVDVLTMLDASRSFIYHAATIISDAPIQKDVRVACHMAKAQSTNTLTFTADRAVQFHGGMGFTYACDTQLYIRRAQWSQQQYGDAEYHRSALAGIFFDK